MVEMREGGAERRGLQNAFRYSFESVELALACLGRKRVNGSSRSDSMPERGSKSTDNSNSVRAMANSGLWLGSVNWGVVPFVESFR